MAVIRIIEWKKSGKEEKEKILRRSGIDVSKAMEAAGEVIKEVERRGDEALIALAKKFDGVELTKKNLRVSEGEFEEAYEEIGKERVEAIRSQVSLSRKFARAELNSLNLDWETQLCEGVSGGVKWTPIESVGIYVPGGNAPYPTVMQILGVPAKVAGVKRIVACVPPKNCTGEVLVAAREAGVDEVYRVGGPGAIAAMAFGTESIKPVLKIAGPGSPIVTAAKLIASTRGVAIDMPAGPSELLVIAEDCGDETPKFVAADLISANEHGKDSASVAVTTSKVLAGEIAGELEKQIQERDRKSDILASLDAYSAIVLVNSLEEVIAFANDYAPEHLEVFAEERRVDEIFAKLENAGSVFLGKWNCKTLGDYAIGVNHILPTGRAAKAFSAVGAWTFLKTLQFSRVSEKGLRELFPVVEEIATAERFDGHRNAVRLRAEKAGVKKQF